MGSGSAPLEPSGIEQLVLMMQRMDAKMDVNARAIKEEMKNEMNQNAQSMELKMDEMRGDMQAWGEEMRVMDCKMAAPRGGATEPTRGSVECVQPAMETGKVEGTSDVTMIDGETCKLGHEGVTEKLKEVTEMEKLTVTETQIIKETKEETNESEGTMENSRRRRRQRREHQRRGRWNESRRNDNKLTNTHT